MQASTMYLIDALKLMTPEKTDLVDRVTITACGSVQYEIRNAAFENAMLIADLHYWYDSGKESSTAPISTLVLPVASIDGISFNFNKANCEAAKVKPAFLAVRSHLRALERRDAKS